MTKTPPPDTKDDVVPSQTEKPAKKSMLRGLHWLLTLSLIATVAYQTHHSQQTQAHVESLQNHAATAFSAQIATLNQKLDTVQNDTDSLKNNINTALKAPIESLIKAQYLLELAEINQGLQHNKQSVINLLNAASKTLEPATEANVMAVRKTLAHDIEAINQQPALDVTDMLSQLAALQNTINTLPFKPTLVTPKTQALLPTPTTWSQQLKANLNLLEKFVVIRHHDDAIKPLMTPLHQTVLRESLRLNLQQAQWAILENNDAIYQASLTQAADDVERLFDISNNDAHHLLETIQSLKAIPLNPGQKITIEALPQLKAITEVAS